jgi:hypothetical protein
MAKTVALQSISNQQHYLRRRYTVIATIHSAMGMLMREAE